MKSTAHAFKSQAKTALNDSSLQQALKRTRSHFIDKRCQALEALGTETFEQLRQQAKSIKEHTLTHLDFYLEHFEKQVYAQGGQVHWAETPQAACDLIVSLCQIANAELIIKSKSMITEEIALNAALSRAQLEVVETDLGEYIIQLAQEPPSHIIAPAVHKTCDQVADLFYKHHQNYGFDTRMADIPSLVEQARQVLRDKFITAGVGITGANMLVAETGSIVLVTNEGNGDLSATLPKIHIVVASLEKVVPTLEDATALLRLLARSATGQEMTAYTTLFTGPRRSEDIDGPEEFHVVLVDNGRSALLGGEFQDILRCIRCGACLNHCPIYNAVGGHAYGWVYPGPMGSVLTPLMMGLQEAHALPDASSLCGRCESVCPLKIPLPQLLRRLRTRAYETQLPPFYLRGLFTLWAFMATHPRLYQAITALKVKLLTLFNGRRGCLRWLPFGRAWTHSRDMPAPQGETFMAAWKKRRR